MVAHSGNKVNESEWSDIFPQIATHLEAVREAEEAVRVEQLREEQVVLVVGPDQLLHGGVAEDGLAVRLPLFQQHDGVDEAHQGAVEQLDVKAWYKVACEHTHTHEIKVNDHQCFSLQTIT